LYYAALWATDAPAVAQLVDAHGASIAKARGAQDGPLLTAMLSCWIADRSPTSQTNRVFGAGYPAGWGESMAAKIERFSAIQWLAGTPLQMIAPLQPLVQRPESPAGSDFNQSSFGGLLVHGTIGIGQSPKQSRITMPSVMPSLPSIAESGPASEDSASSGGEGETPTKP